MSFAWRSIRFLADEGFRKRIVAGLRLHEPSIDIVTAGEAGLLHQPDREVLAYAAAEERILLTHDERTMFTELAQFLAAGRHSPGVFVHDQQLAIGPAIAAVLFVWEASVPDDWRDQIRYLPLRPLRTVHAGWLGAKGCACSQRTTSPALASGGKTG